MTKNNPLQELIIFFSSITAGLRSNWCWTFRAGARWTSMPGPTWACGRTGACSVLSGPSSVIRRCVSGCGRPGPRPEAAGAAGAEKRRAKCSLSMHHSVRVREVKGQGGILVELAVPGSRQEPAMSRSHLHFVQHLRNHSNRNRAQQKWSPRKHRQYE